MKQINKTIYILLAFLIAVTFSCQEKKKVDAGAIDEQNDTYYNEEVGWEISIPHGWKIMTVDHREAINEKGKQALESAMSNTVDVTGLKNLLGFQKDRTNIFNSTSQPFVEEYEGEWLENNKEVINIILEAYDQNGISASITNEGTEKIDGVEFQSYTISVSLPNNEKLTQIMYSALINDLDFGVNINYTKQKHGEEMLSALRASKFKKKNIQH